jgi:hypothetical protein
MSVPIPNLNLNQTAQSGIGDGSGNSSFGDFTAPIINMNRGINPTHVVFGVVAVVGLYVISQRLSKRG